MQIRTTVFVMMNSEVVLIAVLKILKSVSV